MPVKVYEGSDIRNIALIGHGHSGKTTLASGFLYTAGATNRLTRVDEGNAVTDFDDEEVQRKITISTGVAFALHVYPRGAHGMGNEIYLSKEMAQHRPLLHSRFLRGPWPRAPAAR